MIKIETIKYAQYGNCVRIYNNECELIVTTDCGPRIIRYGLIGKENVFCENFDLVVNETTGWKIYGGHRLWHAPEHDPRTYESDNEPVEFEETSTGIHVVGNLEPNTGLLKEITIVMSQVGSEVAIIHKISNANLWPVDLAVWAISVMAPGGKEIVPMSTTDTGLLHNRSMSLWPYTKMNDSRVYWGEKYIALSQDTNCGDSNFKFGITNNLEWAAYFNNNQAFVKRYMYYEGEKYPDNNMSYETYTCNYMLEMETLSPLSKIDSGESISHLELWRITDDIEMPENNDESIDKAVAKIEIPGPSEPGNWFSEDDDCGCSDHDHNHGEDCGCSEHDHDDDMECCSSHNHDDSSKCCQDSSDDVVINSSCGCSCDDDSTNEDSNDCGDDCKCDDDKEDKKSSCCCK